MAVTIRECPHCYTRVGFLDDGICPACGRGLSEQGADSTKTLVTVSQKTVLASVCTHCGEPTHNHASVSRGTRSRARSVLAGLGTLIAFCLMPIFRGGALAVIWRGEDRKKYLHRRIKVRIPLCKGCKRSYGVPNPDRVDFTNETMSFVVDRKIALALSRAETGTASKLPPRER